MKNYDFVSVVLAHPGHEFRLLEWIRRVRPRVHIMTLGSRAGVSTARVVASRKLIDEIGAARGELFGVASDRAFYEAVLSADLGFFNGITERLADSLIEQCTTTVVADSWEDYNPIHDLTHSVARAAVTIAEKRLERPLVFLEYPVVGDHDGGSLAGCEVDRIGLSPEAIAYKTAKMAKYPDIATDTAALIHTLGPAVIGVETLRIPSFDSGLKPAQAPPLYEKHGADRVRAGLYREVLTHAHVAKIATHLAEWSSLPRGTQ